MSMACLQMPIRWLVFVYPRRLDQSCLLPLATWSQGSTLIFGKLVQFASEGQEAGPNEFNWGLRKPDDAGPGADAQADFLFLNVTAVLPLPVLFAPGNKVGMQQSLRFPPACPLVSMRCGPWSLPCMAEQVLD